MSMDVTAYLMGDPSARYVREPTQQERERVGRYNVLPQAKAKTGQGRNISALGIRVRAMKPGDVIEIDSYVSANSHRQYMNREYGWAMTLRRVVMPDGSRGAELRRIR